MASSRSQLRTSASFCRGVNEGQRRVSSAASEDPMASASSGDAPERALSISGTRSWANWSKSATRHAPWREERSGGRARAPSPPHPARMCQDPHTKTTRSLPSKRGRSVGCRKLVPLEGRGPTRGVVLGSPDVVNVVLMVLKPSHPGILPQVEGRCTRQVPAAREAFARRGAWPARSARASGTAPRAAHGARRTAS